VKTLIVSLFVVVAVSAAQRTETFAGVITDSECGAVGHTQMRMGDTDAECARACVAAHGASYVLYDGKAVYALTDQQTTEKFAGQRVRVTGTLDVKTKTIKVSSMTAAE
jgi:hypothetical protein